MQSSGGGGGGGGGGCDGGDGGGGGGGGGDGVYNHQIYMSSLKTIPGIITLNHIGCCIKILANLSNYASIKLHFNKCNLFSNK